MAANMMLHYVFKSKVKNIKCQKRLSDINMLIALAALLYCRK